MAATPRRRDGLSRVAEAPPLQAVWLADMTAHKFLPMTLERPKVLFPLVNKPIIDYTLDWLQSVGVHHVFMVSRTHPEQISAYLGNSHRFSKPEFTVTLIDSLHDSASAGDALRFIHSLNVIRGDFVLVSGDIVANIPLKEALQEHKDRRKGHNFAVMTMLIHKSAHYRLTDQSWSGIDELYMATDPDTKQLVYYEERADYRKRTTSVERKSLYYNRPKSWCRNMQDCYIDICSLEVLSLYSHNSDYHHLRPHFVDGLLVDNTMGYKIFTYEIELYFVERVDNFRSYAAISKAVIQRTRYLVVPEVKLAKNSCELIQGMYRASEISKSHSRQYDDPYSVIGKGSSIGNNPKVVNSVIGEGCVIGSDVSIESCYIWNNVTIENGCKLTESLVCDGVVLKSGAVLNPGVVLSFNVVIGQNFVVPAYSKVSLLQEPIKQDSDKELKDAGQNSGSLNSSLTPTEGECSKEFASLTLNSPSHVVSGGAGYIWSVCKRSLEEWRYSVAPVPEDNYYSDDTFMEDYDMDPDMDSEDIDDSYMEDDDMYPDMDSDNSDYGNIFDVCCGDGKRFVGDIDIDAIEALEKEVMASYLQHQEQKRQWRQSK